MLTKKILKSLAEPSLPSIFIWRFLQAMVTFDIPSGMRTLISL